MKPLSLFYWSIFFSRWAEGYGPSWWAGINDCESLPSCRFGLIVDLTGLNFTVFIGLWGEEGEFILSTKNSSLYSIGR